MWQALITMRISQYNPCLQQQDLNRERVRQNVWLAWPNISTDVGAGVKVCTHGQALLLPGETDNFCFIKEKVRTGNLQSLLNELNLYNHYGSIGNKFRISIRLYNCLFQMTSFGTKEVFPMRHRWNPLVFIQGQIHDSTRHLIPDTNRHAKFIQIYFMDSQNRVEQRMDILHNDGIQHEMKEGREAGRQERNS